MVKATRRVRALSVALSVVGVVFMTCLIVAAVAAVKKRREVGDDVSPIEPLSADSMPTPQKAGAVQAPNSTSDEDVFSGALEDETEGVSKYQTDCFLTDTPCTAFSDECCPGLICVPTATGSKCSHFKGSICIDTDHICNDAVYGVECCDGGVCTPEPGNTGRSRCVLPDIQPRVAPLESPIPAPSPRPSLRPVHN